MVVPFDAELGVTAQSEGFTRYRLWDPAATAPADRPLLLHYPYYLLYSSQVVKQADLVFALYVCGDHFTPEQKRRDFEYYEAITIRDSSLSASIQAIVAAEVGHLDLAYDYFRETALVDLRDHAGNTTQGVHLASLAGAWLVAVAGFGGLRDHGDTLAFAPRLPASLARLCFRLLFRGQRLRVELVPDYVQYELTEGARLQLVHHGEAFTLRPGAAERRSYPASERELPASSTSSPGNFGDIEGPSSRG
jgi:alpha,alpha-trehalose phosphorylase